MSKYTGIFSDFDSTKYEIDKTNVEMSEIIENLVTNSYEKGYKSGFGHGYDLGRLNIDSENIDCEPIKEFASWCYLHGIDFSYTGSNHNEFIGKVIERFLRERKE